jgi:hypothetical protein
MAAIAAAVEDSGRPAFIGAAAAGANAVITLLVDVLTKAGVLGVGVPAALLDAVFAEQLIELLYDLPDDIANQICNSFAFDCHRGFPSDSHCVDAAGHQIKDVDSDNWRSAPGTGSAVSPDNIHMFWDAPGPSVADVSLRGVYGWNRPIQPVSAVVSKPICALVRSAGTAQVHGTVTYKGALIQGAHVSVNSCTFSWSGANGYALTVRAGVPGGDEVRYKVVARYDMGPTVLYGEITVGPLLPGASVWAPIVLLDPPECLRNVEVRGTVRVDDVYLTGADHNEQPFRTTLHVQWGVAKFDESSGTWMIDQNDPAAAIKHTDHTHTGASTGDAGGDLTILVEANDNLSVWVTVTGTIDDLTETHRVLVGKDVLGATIPEFDLDTGGPFPDRAYFRDITIDNRAATAI